MTVTCRVDRLADSPRLLVAASIDLIFIAFVVLLVRTLDSVELGSALAPLGPIDRPFSDFVLVLLAVAVAALDLVVPVVPVAVRRSRH